MSVYSTSFNLDQNFVNTTTWPVILISDLTITLTENITLNNAVQYFVVQSPNVIFEGQNFNITIDGIINYNGLFTNTDNTTIIRNVQINGTNTYSLGTNCGWISTNNFATISYCWTTLEINGSYSGGISGAYNNGTINNCFSTGIISGYGAGGIIGGFNASLVKNCYSTGILTGENCGGIVGNFNAGNIELCYSMGIITGITCGGIAASDNNGSVVNCYYSSSNIQSGGSGGLVSSNNNGNLINCYVASDVAFGSYFLHGLNNTGSVTNCLFETYWQNTNANTVLVGIDGTYWVPYANDTSYILSSFNKYVYPDSPNNIGLGVIENSDAISILNLVPVTSLLINNLISGLSINNNSVLTFTNIADGNYTIKIVVFTELLYNITSYILNVNEIYCFMKGTEILTLKGEMLVENLKIGDIIITGENKQVPIVNIIKTVLKTKHEKYYPVEIPRHYFDINVPNKNTYLTKYHAIKIKNGWIKPEYNMDFFKHTKVENLEYYHIVLPNFLTDTLMANNMECESWMDEKIYRVIFENTSPDHFKYIKFKKI